MQNIEHQITASFQQMTEEIKRGYIVTWTNEIYSWLNRARAYVAQQQSLMGKLSASSIESIEAFKAVLKNRQVARESITKQSIFIDGYTLLNKIGETIRGEEIVYSITVSKTGAALSKGAGKTGGVYTWKMPMSKFLNLLNFSSTRMYMKGSSTIYKMLENEIGENKDSLDYEKWTEEKLNSYSIFLEQVSGASHARWSNVNEGNVLEMFFRIINSGIVPAYNKDKAYWATIVTTIKNTLTNPDPFYKGGDLNNEQIKGLRASVTNINTLINTFQQLLNLFAHSQVGYEVLQPYVRKNAMQQLEQEIEYDQQQIAEQLIEFFTSKISNRDIVLHVE